MKRARTLSAVVLAALAAAGVVQLFAAARNTNIPVTTTIADLGGAYPLRVQSDRQGAYVTTPQVSSIIITNQQGSDWSLTTYYASKRSYAASNRSVLFDLTEQVSAGNFDTPVSTATMPAHMIAKCSRIGVDMVKMAIGQAALCPGTFRFWAPDGFWYRVSFDPENFPEVDPLKVTCTTNDATGCKVWTVTPAGTALTGDDPNPKNLGKLLLIDQSGNILDYGGDYYLSFSITVAR